MFWQLSDPKHNHCSYAPNTEGNNADDMLSGWDGRVGGLAILAEWQKLTFNQTLMSCKKLFVVQHRHIKKNTKQSKSSIAAS